MKWLCAVGIHRHRILEVVVTSVWPVEEGYTRWRCTDCGRFVKRWNRWSAST